MPFHSPPLFLYAMSCKSGELKIGHSARPEKRRIELGYEYPDLRPFTLEYAGQIDVSDGKEIYLAEYHTHRLLAPWLSRQCVKNGGKN